jgi:hypothetical protein
MAAETMSFLIITPIPSLALSAERRFVATASSVDDKSLRRQVFGALKQKDAILLKSIFFSAWHR